MLDGVIDTRNCKKNPEFCRGYCCSQKKSNYGLCVQEESKCDRVLGFPNKNNRQASPQFSRDISDEAEAEHFSENYSDKDDCKDWKDAFNTLYIITVLLLFCFVFLRFRPW
jgi:hypothetical protein